MKNFKIIPLNIIMMTGSEIEAKLEEMYANGWRFVMHLFGLGIFKKDEPRKIKSCFEPRFGNLKEKTAVYSEFGWKRIMKTSEYTVFISENSDPAPLHTDKNVYGEEMAGFTRKCTVNTIISAVIILLCAICVGLCFDIMSQYLLIPHVYGTIGRIIAQDYMYAAPEMQFSLKMILAYECFIIIYSLIIIFADIRKKRTYNHIADFCGRDISIKYRRASIVCRMFFAFCGAAALISIAVLLSKSSNCTMVSENIQGTERTNGNLFSISELYDIAPEKVNGSYYIQCGGSVEEYYVYHETAPLEDVTEQSNEKTAYLYCSIIRPTEHKITTENVFEYLSGHIDSGIKSRVLYTEFEGLSFENYGDSSVIGIDSGSANAPHRYMIIVYNTDGMYIFGSRGGAFETIESFAEFVANDLGIRIKEGVR